MALNILLKRSATPSKRPTAASMAFGELNLNYDAATGGVYYEDSNNAVVKVGPAQVSATAPNSTPAGSAGNSAGEFWYDTVASSLKIWTGSAWVATAGSGSVVGVTGTAPITVNNTDPTNPIIGIDAATTAVAGAVQLSDSTSTTSSILAATPTAVKAAYDLANAALPKAGGTMTGAITAAATGIIFSDASSVVAISNSTSTTSSTTAASATAVKGAYDLAALALPLAGGTVTGDITFSGAGVGIVFGNASTVEAISDSTSTTSSIIAASATAVKSSYDLAALALPLAGGTMTGVIAFDAGQTFSVTGIQDATAVAKGVVQVGTNIAVASGVISVASASTSVPGIVQLNNTVGSTSITEALTAAQGKSLQDQIDALVVTSNLTLAGTFNATTGLVDSVTTAGTAASFVVGSAVPAAAAGNADYFVIVDVAGSSGPAGSAPYHVGDWFLSNGTAWTFLNVGTQAVPATTSVEGVVFLATNAEVQAGSDTSNKAVIPSSLQSKLSDSTSTTSSTTIASSTAVKSAYDLANAALPKSGGTMTGAITAAAAGVIFSDASTVTAITNSTSTTSSTVASSATAVKSAYDLANAALPKAGGTVTGDIVFSGAGVGVVFGDASTVESINDSTSTTSSITAASSTAVKSAYDLANAAVPKSVVTAKGDILVGTASATVGVLPVGTAGQIVIVDASTASGLVYTSDIDGGTY
jgi:hypothetical protein